MSPRIAILLAAALSCALATPPARAARRDDVGPRRTPAVLRARGVELRRADVARALRDGEVSWSRLREMHSEETLLAGRETKSEFLVMNELAIPRVVRHLFRDQDEAHRQRAQEAYEKAVAGEPWERLVAVYSTQPMPGASGDLGVVAYDNLVAPFHRQMFTAPLGIVQPPVQTMFGWHVGKVTEILPPRDVTRADGTVVRRPETRRVQQILVVWDVGEYEDGRVSDLRVELAEITESIRVEVLDRSWCDEFPNWCGTASPAETAP